MRPDLTDGQILEAEGREPKEAVAESARVFGGEDASFQALMLTYLATTPNSDGQSAADVFYGLLDYGVDPVTLLGLYLEHFPAEERIAAFSCISLRDCGFRMNKKTVDGLVAVSMKQHISPISMALSLTHGNTKSSGRTDPKATAKEAEFIPVLKKLTEHLGLSLRRIDPRSNGGSYNPGIAFGMKAHTDHQVQSIHLNGAALKPEIMAWLLDGLWLRGKYLELKNVQLDRWPEYMMVGSSGSMSRHGDPRLTLEGCNHDSLHRWEAPSILVKEAANMVSVGNPRTTSLQLVGCPKLERIDWEMGAGQDLGSYGEMQLTLTDCANLSDLSGLRTAKVRVQEGEPSHPAHLSLNLYNLPALRRVDGRGWSCHTLHINGCEALEWAGNLAKEKGASKGGSGIESQNSVTVKNCGSAALNPLGLERILCYSLNLEGLPNLRDLGDGEGSIEAKGMVSVSTCPNLERVNRLRTTSFTLSDVPHFPWIDPVNQGEWKNFHVFLREGFVATGMGFTTFTKSATMDSKPPAMAMKENQ